MMNLKRQLLRAMSTPRKNFNCTSPYVRLVQQYPSQSEEYISFRVGGQFQSEIDKSSVKLGYQYGSNRQRCRSSSFFSNPESYNAGGNYSTQKQCGTPRKPGGYYWNRIQNKEKHEQAPISSYLHPSMTEDPWKEFMVRIDAINNSRISVKSEPDKGSISECTETEDVMIEADVV